MINFEPFRIRATIARQAAKDRLVELIKRQGSYSAARFKADQPTNLQIHFVDVGDTMTKHEVRELLRKYSHRGIFSRFSYRMASSSGTSGLPLVFPQPIDALQWEQAFIDHLWKYSNFDFKTSRVAVVRGGIFAARTITAGNRLLVSSAEWDEASILEKACALTAFEPTHIHCYPSVLERLLRRCAALRLPLPTSVKFVLAGS